MHRMTTGGIARGMSREFDAQATAACRVALQLACGQDLDRALTAAPPERQRIAERLERALRRERMKGLNRHWSYDLNRHIALKQAAEMIAHPAGLTYSKEGRKIAPRP